MGMGVTVGLVVLVGILVVVGRTILVAVGLTVIFAVGLTGISAEMLLVCVPANAAWVPGSLTWLATWFPPVWQPLRKQAKRIRIIYARKLCFMIHSFITWFRVVEVVARNSSQIKKNFLLCLEYYARILAGRYQEFIRKQA